MTRLILCIFSLLLAANLHSQKSYELLLSLQLGAVDDFNVDQFKNIYVVNGTELIKYDPDAEKLYSFSQPILGDIYQVDVQNALNPYVFYRDVNRLVIVDNRLNANAEINFTEYGFLDVQFISFADQNNVWFYDQATDKIYRFNMQMKSTSNQSLNITQISGSENQPRGMISTIDQVYLNVPDKGILVFDAVCAFQKLIPVKDVVSFAVRKKQLYIIQDEKLQIYDLNTARLLPVALTEKDMRSIKVTTDRIYLLAENSLKIYREIR